MLPVTFPNAPVENKQRLITQQLMRRIHDLLMSGKVRPGDRLPSEREWAQELGATRQSVREGLRALEVLGYVERRPRGGTYAGGSRLMTEFMPVLLRMQSGTRFILEILELRRVIEPALCALAARRMDETSLAEIRFWHEALGEGPWGDEATDRDAAFHLAIARATKNAAIAALMASLESVFSSWRRDVARRGGAASLHGSRAAIVRALERRDAAGASAAMLLHLDEVAFALREILDLPTEPTN